MTLASEAAEKLHIGNNKHPNHPEAQLSRESMSAATTAAQTAALRMGEENAQEKGIPPAIATENTKKVPPALSPVSPLSARSVSPPRAAIPRHITGSPSLAAQSAESQIFERNVQDPSLPPPASPAIPSHIQTENYIPPVLEATTFAITDPNVNPDRVEIVSTTSHEPAIHGSADAYITPPAEEQSPKVQPVQPMDEALSGDAYSDADKRRLSFISFADVVHAEQVEATASTTSIDELGASVTSSPPPPASPPVSAAIQAAQVAAMHRSPSPIRSVGSGTSSPPSGLGVGLDKKQSVHSDLTVETLSQALRRHGSGDLGASARREPTSAGHEENPNPFKK